MAEDATGAVRRTPNPPRTGDHQTPETAPQERAGTTNSPTPVSQDAGNGTDELRADPPGLAELRAKLLEDDPNSLVFAIPDNEHENFLDLPECTACGGTGKDDHATPFEEPLAVHFAGPPVEIVGRRRQLCMWCGHVLRDSPRAGDNAMQPWPVGALVRIEDGIGTLAPHEPGDELPPGCCALPDDQPQAFFEAAAAATGTTVAEVVNILDEMVAVDPVDGYAADLCGKHTGTCSNRCLLPANHPGECDDDPPKPSQAQETRAAADWPPEPIDQHWDEREPHACPGGCGHQVFTHQFACRADWHRLPLDIRRGITGNYRRDRAAHLEAMGDAMQWYANNPREVPNA